MRVIESQNIRNIYVSLNYYCNNQCLMCGVPYYKHNKYNSDLDFFINEINRIPFDIEPNDIITLSGGEPFVFSGIWDLINYIRENHKCRIAIFTNGRALRDKEITLKLADYKIDKLVIPFFSFREDVYDLIAGSKNAYKEVCEALKNLNESNLYHEVKFLPMKQNMNDIKTSYLFIKEKFSYYGFEQSDARYEINNGNIKKGMQFSKLEIDDFGDDDYSFVYFYGFSGKIDIISNYLSGLLISTNGTITVESKLTTFFGEILGGCGRITNVKYVYDGAAPFVVKKAGKN